MGQKDTFVIAQGTDGSTLDPHAHSEVTTGNILFQIYEPLVRRNVKMEIEPWLAVSWQRISETCVEFRLRENVFFHNGEPFDAEAVKFSFERMADPTREPKFPPYGRFSSIDHVEIIDTYTVRVHTNRIDPNLMSALTNLQVIPPKYFAEVGEKQFAVQPCGTGPFRFVEWKRDQGEVLMDANDQYWGGVSDIRKLKFVAVPDGGDRVSGLLAGTIDLAANFPPSEKDRAEAQGFSVVGTPSVGVMYIGINTHHEILKNVKVRRAIAHGINVQELIDRELNGAGYPLSGPVYPQAFGVDPNLPPIAYDPEKSRELLAEAGYPDGVEIKLEVPDGRFTQDKEICTRIAEQLEKVGIRIRLDIQPWGPFIARFRNHEYDSMYYVGWGNIMFDPDDVYRNAFISPNPWNPTDYHHEEMAKLTLEAAGTLDEERRRELYYKAARIFQEDLPWIPLFQCYDMYGLNPDWTWEARMDESIYVCDIKKKSK
jgi:peptide/nickel transport system substrate-binding protein